MRNVFSITALFVLVTVATVQFRKGSKIREEYLKQEEIEQLHENESDGPEEFLKFHQGIRTRANEEKPGYPANYQWAELQKAQHLSSARRSSLSARTQSGGNGVISYTERGPGNVPGRTRGLLVDPDDATHNTWFAGSAGGGIWKTSNGGATWKWLTPSIPNLATTTLAMAESNHNIIYAGTGEGFGLVDGINGNGIFKSIDHGISWNFLTNSTPLGSINRLAIDPTNENNILAAANSGIYHSIDGGNNWTKVY